MTQWVFGLQKSLKKKCKAIKVLEESKVLILGLTFKENCNDMRNTKVLDIVESLEKQY